MPKIRSRKTAARRPTLRQTNTRRKNIKRAQSSRVGLRGQHYRPRQPKR